MALSEHVVDLQAVDGKISSDLGELRAKNKGDTKQLAALATAHWPHCRRLTPLRRHRLPRMTPNSIPISFKRLTWRATSSSSDCPVFIAFSDRSRAI